MAITEKELFEKFGFEAPADADAAEPAQQAPDTPLPETQAEDPQSSVVNEEPEQPAAEEGVVEPADSTVMTEAQRSANAERRRKQEERQKAAVDAAVEAALKAQKAEQEKTMASFFAAAGMKNPYTGEQITNMEQFVAYRQQHGQEQMKQGKLTPEALDKAIEEHPAVQQAQRLVQQAAEQERQRLQEEDQAVIAKELEAIRSRDPSVQTVQDLLKLPEGKKIEELVRRGYSFEDAHYLATRERREREVTEKAKQQAMVSARGKEHLTGTGGARGDGAITVPGNVMALYRKLNPKASEAEIIASYNKYMKK